MGIVAHLNQYSRTNSGFMNVGLCLRNRVDCSFFEGESDADFYKPFIYDKTAVRPRICQYLNGRDKVESAIQTYRNFLKTVPAGGEPHTKLSFCLDGDYDRLMGKAFEEDRFIYYQLWRKSNGSWLGYNDLECFLVDTKIFGHVLKGEYGVPLEMVDVYRREIIKAASCIGAFRYACRTLFKEGDDEPVFCDGNHDEMDATFFCQRGWIEIDCGRIVIVSDLLEQVKNWFLPKDSACEQYKRVLEGIRLAGEILNQPADIKYCRGHDLTELLYFLLWETVERGPKNPKEIEKSLYALPSENAMEVRRDLVGKLMDFPIYADFDKKLVDAITGVK